MARLTSGGAIVSDNGCWFWSGVRGWKHLRGTAPKPAPLGRERRDVARLVRDDLGARTPLALMKLNEQLEERGRKLREDFNGVPRVARVMATCHYCGTALALSRGRGDCTTCGAPLPPYAVLLAASQSMADALAPDPLREELLRHAAVVMGRAS